MIKFFYFKIDNFVNNTLELLKNSQLLIEKILNNKKTNSSKREEIKSEKDNFLSNSEEDNAESSEEEKPMVKSKNSLKNKILKSKVKYKLGKSIKNVKIEF